MRYPEKIPQRGENHNMAPAGALCDFYGLITGLLVSTPIAGFMALCLKPAGLEKTPY
jgi:hypothetical protein